MSSKKVNIYVHIFDSKIEIIEKLFPEKSGIINEKYGTVEKRIFKYEENLLNDSFFHFLFGFGPTFIVNFWVCEICKYPELSCQNLNPILTSIKKSIKGNENKSHIFIKFGNEFIKEFKIYINSFDIDCPFYYMFQKKIMIY